MAMDAFDLVVVGAGPAGLRAATVVSRLGGHVLVLDESACAGGRLPSQVHPEPTISLRPKWSIGAQKAEELLEDASAAGTKILCGVSVWGLSPDGFVGTVPADPSQIGHNVPTGFQAKAVLIAAGATQNPLVLPGWTLPGVITAGAALTLINVHRVLPGRCAVVIGIDPLSISAALLMSACGMDVKGILLPPGGYASVPSTPHTVIKELARALSCLPNSCLKLSGKVLELFAPLSTRLLPLRGIPIDSCRLMLRRMAQSIEGDGKVAGIRVVSFDSKGRPVDRRVETWKVDTVVTSAGLHPLVELCQVAGCPLVYSAPLGGWVPLHSPKMETPLPGVFVAGSITGVEGARVAEAQGRVAGFSIAKFLKLGLDPEVNRQLEFAELGVLQARESSFPFFPDVKLGRTQLTTAWNRWQANG
jgi:sarcosine oxidase, subunit alpha